jgi:SpoVK/Ycf46/Vps4 family AAA+-type ATPase
MSVSEDQLKKLFQSFRDQNDLEFHKTAEAIIAREAAANHHYLAKELKKSLGDERGFMKKATSMTNLTLVPKDRRSGEDLINLQQSDIDQTKIVLGKVTLPRIERVLVEHRNRHKLAAFGVSPKNKLLFWGPPGCGKTFTAFHLAHELGIPIGVLRLNAAISSYLGDTASHLQRVFDLANRTPMVLLLDEVDAVGKNRDDKNDVGELKRVVNSLLQAMDSFNSKNSILIAASNHQYLLDPALWRRFDDIISFPLPEKVEREKYLQIRLNGVSMEGNIPQISKLMASFSFADIEKVTTEAIKTMVLEGRDYLSSKDVTDEVANFKQATFNSQIKIEA